jgi:hypothetical protein
MSKKAVLSGGECAIVLEFKSIPLPWQSRSDSKLYRQLIYIEYLLYTSLHNYSTHMLVTNY